MPAGESGRKEDALCPKTIRRPVSEDNKALVRREIEELFNHNGNLDVAEEVYASDFVGHDPTMPEGIHGIEGARQVAAGVRSAFPDLTCTIEDQIAEGDKVVSRWSASGTHQGETEEMGPPRVIGWR